MLHPNGLRSLCDVGTGFAYYIGNANKGETMLQNLLNTGVVYVYAGNLVSRTVDGFKFVICSCEQLDLAEEFLGSYWDINGNGVSADAPNNW